VQRQCWLITAAQWMMQQWSLIVSLSALAVVGLFCLCLQVSCALWVLAEYSSTMGEVEAALAAIHAGIGPLPLLQVVSGT
jgi:hypothetical protein